MISYFQIKCHAHKQIVKTSNLSVNNYCKLINSAYLQWSIMLDQIFAYSIVCSLVDHLGPQPLPKLNTRSSQGPVPNAAVSQVLYTGQCCRPQHHKELHPWGHCNWSVGLTTHPTSYTYDHFSSIPTPMQRKSKCQFDPIQLASLIHKATQGMPSI